MKTNLVAYGFTAVAFLIIDGIWRGSSPAASLRNRWAT
jgi:hypothetical protein